MFLQSTNTEENTDGNETNLDVAEEYEENEDGNKLGRLFFTVFDSFIHSKNMGHMEKEIMPSYLDSIIHSKSIVSGLGEIQLWEDSLDCDNQQVLKSPSKG